MERKEDSEDAVPCGEANSASLSEEMNSDSSVLGVQHESTSLDAIVAPSENGSNPDSCDSSDSVPSYDTAYYVEDVPTTCNVMTSIITEHSGQICSGPVSLDVSSTRAPPLSAPSFGPDIRGPTGDLSGDSQQLSSRSPPLMKAHQIIDVSQSDSLRTTDSQHDMPLNLDDFVQKLAANRVNPPLFLQKSVIQAPEAFYLNTSDLPPLCLTTFANDLTVLPFVALLGKQSNEILSMHVHDFLMEVFYLISTKYYDDKQYEFERRKIMWGLIKISTSIAKYLVPSDNSVKSDKLIKKYNYVIEMLNYISFYFRHGPDMILDATVIPANIKYPTDFELIHDARVILEYLSYKLLLSIIPDLDKVKNTYKVNAGYDPASAHSEYLAIVKRKKCPKEDKQAAQGRALNYLNHAINYFNDLRSQLPEVKLYRRSERKVPVIKSIYDQQLGMHESEQNTCKDRIVSIDQSFVHPIYRGKIPMPTEFGMKVHLMAVKGFVSDIHHSWDAFNEGTELVLAIENYVQSYDLLPAGALADEIYKSTFNCIVCKCLGIRFTGKRLKKKNPVLPSDDDKAQTKQDYVMRILVEAIIGTLKTRYELSRLSSITADNQIMDVQLAILAKNTRKLVLMGIWAP